MGTHHAGFAAVYAWLLAVVVAVPILVWKEVHLPPARHVTVAACQGVTGFERCLRQEVIAQGAPEPTVTCGQPTNIPGTGREYTCELGLGLGAGCYDVTAARSPTDAYPIISSLAQRSSC